MGIASSRLSFNFFFSPFLCRCSNQQRKKMKCNVAVFLLVALMFELISSTSEERQERDAIQSPHHGARIVRDKVKLNRLIKSVKQPLKRRQAWEAWFVSTFFG